MKLPNHEELTKLTNTIASKYNILESDRQDILQIFYKRYYSHKTYKPTYGSIMGYASIAIKNICIDWITSDRRYRTRLNKYSKEIKVNYSIKSDNGIISVARGFVPKTHVDLFDDWIIDTPIEDVAKRYQISVFSAKQRINRVIRNLKNNSSAIERIKECL